MTRRPKLTPEAADDLLQTLADPEFFNVPCITCERPISAHSDEEIQICGTTEIKPATGDN